MSTERLKPEQKEEEEEEKKEEEEEDTHVKGNEEEQEEEYAGTYPTYPTPFGNTKNTRSLV